MSDFWANISRYPRFFVSSLAGLILIILTPFKNLFKIRQLRFSLIISFFIFCLVIILILQNMTGL